VAVQEADQLVSERVAGGILPRVLNTFDMVAIFIAIVLFVTNTSIFAAAGPAAFVYLVLGFLAFMIPGAIVTGQLGLMFPGEGSIYVWTYKALGTFWSFFAGFCAWWPGILVMLATGDVVVSVLQYLDGNTTWDPWVQGLLIMGVIAISMVLSWLRFRATQNLVNVIFVSYLVAIALAGIAGLHWLSSGHSSVQDFSASKWGLNGNNITFFGATILALLGVEVPLNMGVEIRDTRSITRYLLWGSIIVFLAYVICIWAVFVVVPAADAGNPSGLVEAAQRSMGQAAEWIMGILIIGFFLFNTTVYNYSFARLLFVSGLDRRLPHAMSRVNSNKVPWVAVLVQSIIAMLVTAIAFIIAPSAASGSGANLSAQVYNITQAGVTVIWCLSMVIMFVDVLIILRKYPAQFGQSRLAHPHVFYLCSALGLISSFSGMWVTFKSPWLNTIGTSDWRLALTVIVLASLAVAIVVYNVGVATADSARGEGPGPAIAGSGGQ
jgi:amino acid transporter